VFGEGQQTERIEGAHRLRVGVRSPRLVRSRPMAEAGIGEGTTARESAALAAP
jgi:hypothetical protein